jgi:hypothetical protein
MNELDEKKCGKAKKVQTMAEEIVKELKEAQLKPREKEKK